VELSNALDSAVSAIDTATVMQEGTDSLEKLYAYMTPDKLKGIVNDTALRLDHSRGSSFPSVGFGLTRSQK
jgi:hypothetical protein